MHALQPELRARRPIAEFVAGMTGQLDGRGRDPSHPVPRIGRHQPLDATATPALPPPPNRPGTFHSAGQRPLARAAMHIPAPAGDTAPASDTVAAPSHR